MISQPKEKLIEFRQIDDSKFHKFSIAIIVVIIIGIVGVCWYGFTKITAQLSMLADKIEEVRIEDSSSSNISSDTNIATNNQEEIATGVQNNSENTAINKDNLKLNIINCSDYIKLINTVVNLKQKVDSGESYQKEIILLTLFAKDDKALSKYVDILNDYADSGVTNSESLISEFKEIENDMIIASKITDEKNSDWKYRFLKVFSKFIFIKKVGERALRDGGVNMIVIKAKNMIEENNLLQAIKELEKIDNVKAKNIAEIWIGHAKDSLYVQNITNELVGLVFNNSSCHLNNANKQLENNNK